MSFLDASVNADFNAVIDFRCDVLVYDAKGYTM